MITGLTSEHAAGAAGTQDRTATRMETADLKLKEAAGEVVGQIFFAPLLAQMRASNLKSEFGHGGRGEEVFGAQLDSLLANEIGKSKQSPIADVIWRRYREQQRAITALEGGGGQEWAA